MQDVARCVLRDLATSIAGSGNCYRRMFINGKQTVGAPSPARLFFVMLRIAPGTALLQGMSFSGEHVSKTEQPHIGHALWIEYAVEVVAFMLHDPGMKAMRFAINRPATLIKAAIAYVGIA